MGFSPSFNALFSGGLVEQCIAIVQNNQEAAIAAYAANAFAPQYGGVLDSINEYHKAEIADPQTPCLTVTAADEEPNKQVDQTQVRCYTGLIFVHLDVSCTDPDQLADWCPHYARLLDQIFSTVTYGLASTAIWSTPMPIVWPAGTPSRHTAAFAPGAVKSMFLSRPHIGMVPGDETATPRKRISIALQFDMQET
jgi:hypothetical protein